jgi:hypothetical protein
MSGRAFGFPPPIRPATRRHFGNRAQFWLDLQSQYDIAVVVREDGDEISRDVGTPSGGVDLFYRVGYAGLMTGSLVNPLSAVALIARVIGPRPFRGLFEISKSR